MITHLGDTQGLTLLVGVLSLAVIVALRRFAPAVPGSLVAVLLGIVAVKVFGLDHHGVEIVGRSRAACRRSASRRSMAAMSARSPPAGSG